jgi:hypothetical protein
VKVAAPVKVMPLVNEKIGVAPAVYVIVPVFKVAVPLLEVMAITVALEVLLTPASPPRYRPTTAALA